MNANTQALLQAYDPLTAVTPSIRFLDEASVPAMIALQDTDTSGQVLPRSAAQLQAHFAGGQPALGAFLEDRLVGQALITETLCGSFRRSTLGGVLVAAEAQGLGIMKSLLDEWSAHATARGCDMLHARVGVNNSRSLHVFQEHGGLVTAFIAPSPDGPPHDVHWLYKSLKSNFNDAATVTSSGKAAAYLSPPGPPASPESMVASMKVA